MLYQLYKMYQLFKMYQLVLTALTVLYVFPKRQAVYQLKLFNKFLRGQNV